MSNGSTVKASPYGMQPTPGLTLTGNLSQKKVLDWRANDRLSRDLALFVEDKEREPYNASELGRYLRRKITTKEFKRAISIMNNAMAADKQKAFQVGMAKKIAAGQKESKSIEGRMRSRRAKLYDSEKFTTALDAAVLDYETANPNEGLDIIGRPDGEKEVAARERIANDMLDKIVQRDPIWQRSNKKLQAVQKRMDKEINRPRPKRPQKERPSGGGTLTVEDDMPNGTKAGTIIMTQGPWMGATQGKMVPSEDGKTYELYTRKTAPGKDKYGKPNIPSMSKPWVYSKTISSGDVYDKTKGQHGTIGEYNKDLGEEDVSAEDLRIAEDDKNRSPVPPRREKPAWSPPVWDTDPTVTGSTFAELPPQDEGRSPMLPSREGLQGNRAELGDQMWGLDPEYPSDQGYFSNEEEDVADPVGDETIRGLGRRGLDYLKDLAPSDEEDDRDLETRLREYTRGLLPYRSAMMPTQNEPIEDEYDEYYGYDPYKEYDEYGERW